MAEKSFEMDKANAAKVKLVATSRKDAGRDDHVFPARGLADNHFKSAQWSADGTCVITNSADNNIHTFVIPPELLDEKSEPLQLDPYSTISNHDPTDAVVAYPGFNLQDVSTTLLLSAVREYPIRLNSALSSTLVASYPLVNPTTETYIKPHCLTFTSDGSHFVAGSENLISTFDFSRPGQGPISSIVTGSKSTKTAWHNQGTSIRGIVSAVAADPVYNVLAAGTLTRHVGLYETNSSGECLGVFSVRGTDADIRVGGFGITQMLWSLCGKYLYIAERKSDGVMVYDIRNTGQLLCWLEGRHADTHQRMQIDLARIGDSEQHDIWAGGTDGVVRVWKTPYLQEGGIEFSWQHSLHNDAVSSSVVHPSGGVLATVSGQRRFVDFDDLDGKSSQVQGDVSLKLWSLYD